jgi:peptidoglycan hydrolase-like protein with peptidoglycan-binding domain
MFNIVTLAMKLMQYRDRIPEIADLVERLSPDEPKQPPSEYKVGSVKWLQESLNELIDAGLEVDGDYGPATKRAVSDYQAKHRLEVDGWAGPETVNSIVSKQAALA